MSETNFSAFVVWPSAPLTEYLVRRALEHLPLPPQIVSSIANCQDKRILQWSTYDVIDHELSLSSQDTVQSSSYIIRKALIRKHFLHRCIQAYTAKNPSSLLVKTVPRTWDIDISFADELDEMWTDELWDLAEQMRSSTNKCWILKPGMADRGIGIRLFNSKESLRDTFEDFESDSDNDSEYDVQGSTGVVTSQLRHFVIQEYLSNPVLIDPNQIYIGKNDIPVPQGLLRGYKFHLRAYCVASGALSVYLYPRVLALFSSEPYVEPTFDTNSTASIDLRPHLTNTCLQQDTGESSVRLLQELVGCQIISGHRSAEEVLSEEDVEAILSQMSDILAETFSAAVQSPVHFQPHPNAFELYGVDFLLTDDGQTPTIYGQGQGDSGGAQSRFRVNLLEINSEPAIEMTGSRLKWILEDLFIDIADICIWPFFATQDERSRDLASIGGRNSRRIPMLRKCLELSLHGLRKPS